MTRAARSGILKTSQREAVARALAGSARPLTPQEILRAAKPFAPGIGIATVYRTVNLLAAEGRLVPVAMPDGPVRYEISGKAHHHHVACRKCKSVFEAAGCSGKLRLVPPPGFRVEGHEVIVHGVCRRCSA